MNNNVSTGGVGFLSLLTLLFITLKLIGKINWSWIWVIAPSWIPVAIFFLGVIILLSTTIIKVLIKDRPWKK